MSGHNRWSKIKHKKEASDSKKSKVWTKVIKELTLSARLGGGDINGNPRLRAASDKARSVNMPNDTIDRAIKKGTGDLEGVNYEEFNYEVFGPGGAAVLVEIMTDNRNRTASDIRSVITRHGGNLGASGSVGWMFKKQGLIVFEKAVVDEDKVTELAIELGADDIRAEGESLVVVTEPKQFEEIRDKLKKAG
ncbi:MAG TPA: YebC/PmpR family DNA-binding transcriptional regulator, partial [Polyangia bacterium]|nr:YebC/PmpR family DNA-binding transcriptional regulator [Polyangia bacterium]